MRLIYLQLKHSIYWPMNERMLDPTVPALVGGATCAAVAIGALLMNSGPSQEERAEAAAESLKEETLSHDPGRAKKKVKKPKPSKPVLPKKKKQVVQEKNRWDNSSSEEEEPMYVEPEPTQKKKGKKGKGAAPVEDEWSTVPSAIAPTMPKRKKSATAPDDNELARAVRAATEATKGGGPAAVTDGDNDSDSENEYWHPVRMTGTPGTNTGIRSTART
eukprot:COSAG01_NODE_28486_length_660_cov_0.634581_1_plen_217_part_10